MKNQEPDIDTLLEQWKAPETPAWFKTRVLQAVREESAPTNDNPVWEFLRGKLSLRYVALATGCAVVAVMLALTLFNDETALPVEVVTMEKALESFASYTQEQSAWGGDIY